MEDGFGIQSQLDFLSGAVAALRARIEQLERGEPRMDLQPRTPDAVEEFIAEVKKQINIETSPVDRSKVCTTNGKPVAEVRASQTNKTGQHDGYIILCEDERKKGFVRPYRDSYRHVGQPPECKDYRVREVMGGPCLNCGQPQPAHVHRFGCNYVTTMGRALSETYARDPKFYGATFCVSCNKHLPVSEFVWTADGQEVGS